MEGNTNNTTQVKTQANRKLRFFRLEGHQKVPYIMELDHELTVVAEYEDKKSTRTTSAHARRAQEMEAPAKKVARVMARWCTKAVKENPIEGTDGLRKAYFKEFDALTEKFASKNKTCPGCEVGKLMRGYREKLKDAGHFDGYE